MFKIPFAMPVSISLGVVIAILVGSIILSIVLPKKESAEIPSLQNPAEKEETKGNLK